MRTGTNDKQDRAAAPRRILAALVVLAAAAADGQPVARQPLGPPRAADFVELGDVSRPAEALESTREWTLPLVSVGAGTVKLGAGSKSARPAMIAIELRTGTAGVIASCRLNFPAASPQWQDCRLEVTEPLAGATLAVRTRDCGSGECYLSSPSLRAPAPAPRHDIFVILIDTLRADRLKTYNPRVTLGEAIDRFAADAVVFEQARSSSSWTRPAVASLFTGREVHMHRVHGWFDILPAELPTLAEGLQASGYETYAWSTNFHIIPKWRFGRGFDRFEFANVLKQRAPKVLARVREVLRSRDRTPSFFYIHLLDPHGPYMPEPRDHEAILAQPALLETLPDPARRDDPTSLGLYTRYLGEIRSVDRDLGGFFDELRRQGRYDDALIVLLADHGEEFWDHGGEGHGNTLYEEVLRIPLIVKLPKRERAGTRITTAVAIEDLMPTLLDFAGAPIPSPIEGRSLLPVLRGSGAVAGPPHVAFLQLFKGRLAAVVDEQQRKFILDPLSKNQLYDLTKDPAERLNLAAAQAQLADVRRAEIEKRLAAAESGWHVLACQGAQSEAVRLTVRGDVRAVGRIGLEREDVFRGTAGGVSTVRLRLRAARENREALSARFTGAELRREIRASRDADELAIDATPGAGLVVEFASRPLPYTMAPHVTLLRAAKQFALGGTEAKARPHPGQTPACNLKTDDTYVRIWYVPPPHSVDEAEVDEALKEKLRALGYDLEK